MEELVGGAIVMGYFVAGLFFLRFWKQTHDRLFAIFGGAFWLLGVQRLALTLVLPYGLSASRTVWYAVRLVAFLLILVAIVDKNRGESQAQSSTRIR